MFNVRDKRLTDVESQNRAISITEICSVFTTSLLEHFPVFRNGTPISAIFGDDVKEFRDFWLLSSMQ